MTTKLQWCGIRESETQYSQDIIGESFTVHGSGQNCLRAEIGKYVDHNDLKNIGLIGEYYIRSMKKCVAENPETLFMFYNQQHYYELLRDENLLSKVIGLNDPGLVEFASNKFLFTDYIRSVADVIEHKILAGKDISQDLLKTISDGAGCVLQQQMGSGGSGTTLITTSDIETATYTIYDDIFYMVTPYYEANVPVNIHCLISETEIILSPPSIQIIELEMNHLSYTGCDFIAYSTYLSPDAHKKHLKQSYEIAAVLQKLGYRGVCGIDSIVVGDNVYFMEVNARFQNSSTALNKSLEENGLPSLQKQHYACHVSKTPLIDIGSLTVPYSVHIVDYGQTTHSELNAKPVCLLDKNSGEDETFVRDGYSHTEIYDQPIAQHFVFGKL